MIGHWKCLLRQVSESPSLEVFQERLHALTECHGPGDQVVLGHRLDLMLSKVFSSLGDSVMIVTLQGPGDARGHWDSMAPNTTKGPIWHYGDSQHQSATVIPSGLMEVRGHYETKKPNKIKRQLPRGHGDHGPS